MDAGQLVGCVWLLNSLANAPSIAAWLVGTRGLRLLLGARGGGAERQARVFSRLKTKREERVSARRSLCFAPTLLSSHPAHLHFFNV